MLASPSLAVERESMEEDDSTPPPDSIPRDITEMGQKRKPAWVCQTFQETSNVWLLRCIDEQYS